MTTVTRQLMSDASSSSSSYSSVVQAHTLFSLRAPTKITRRTDSAMPSGRKQRTRMPQIAHLSKKKRAADDDGGRAEAVAANAGSALSRRTRAVSERTRWHEQSPVTGAAPPPPKVSDLELETGLTDAERYVWNRKLNLVASDSPSPVDECTRAHRRPYKDSARMSPASTHSDVHRLQ